MRALAARDEQRRAADRAERPHGRIDAAGNDAPGALEELLERGCDWRGMILGVLIRGLYGWLVGGQRFVCVRVRRTLETRLPEKCFDASAARVRGRGAHAGERQVRQTVRQR